LLRDILRDFQPLITRKSLVRHIDKSRNRRRGVVLWHAFDRVSQQ
jgi:hypothetical protein